ncbi:hypothetical protein [Acetobacter sp.]|uniref:hypothetical protein n=1 Tax=Acetobacter sp. TaxID=440 RepID=UPI0039E99C54
MPYDGNGNYTLPPVYKATPGTEIITTQHNTPLEDIQAALNAVLLRNGSAPITGNWNMGTNRITFLEDGVANTDAANVGQLKALLNNTALTGVPTVPAVTDWTAYQPVGAKDADARYARLTGGNTFTDAQNITGAINVTGTISALVASSTQKVTFRRASTYGGINSYDGSSWHPLMINDDDTASTARGTLAFSNVAQTFTQTQTFSGQTLVPDVDTFDGKDALNAETAEGRYVKSTTAEGRYIKSVPVSPNRRITDIWENADGRAVFGDGTSAPILANLADLPFSDTGLKEQAFMQWTTLDQYGHGIFTFPTAFRAGTVPVVTLMIDCEPAGTYAGHTRTYSFVRNGTAPSISNTGFMLAVGVTDGSGVYVSTVPVIACVRAVGYF